MGNKYLLYARSWTMELNDNKVRQLIKDELISLGYNEDVRVETVMMNNTVNYYAHDVIRYRFNDTKTITIVDCERAQKIIKKRMEANNMEVTRLYPVFGEKVATYTVSYKEVNNKILVRK